MPRVLNKYKDPIPPDAVYVGRPSKWGNPFVLGRDGTRDEVIAKFSDYLATRPDLLAVIHELRDRDLVCFCAPKTCHADVLLELSNHPDLF